MLEENNETLFSLSLTVKSIFTLKRRLVAGAGFEPTAFGL